MTITSSWLLSSNVLSLLLLCLALQVRGIVASLEAARARRESHIGVKSSALLHGGVVGLEARSIVVLYHIGVLQFERSGRLQFNILRHELLKVLILH